mmetsp:Transcript_155211/g.275219  ORF Transcript_155211/g.275219 Transcript_155211/m.275219 type:complete len:103 (-) Transcript_155211:112-420(-)
MIARQLSNKLKVARISQKRSETSLEESSSPPQGTTVNMDVKTLLSSGQQYEERVAALERSLEQNKREIGDLKLAFLLGASIAGFGAATMFDNPLGRVFQQMP